MLCNNCGTENNDSDAFCKNCGVSLGQQTANQSNMNQNAAGQPFVGQPNSGTYSGQPYSPYNGTTPESMIPEEYKPITMWGYFGYELLFSIPCVGFILLLVFSFGGTKNKNLRNFARSYFCFMIIMAVIVVVFLLIGGAGLIGASSYYY